MQARRLANRREFLRLTALGAVGTAILAACQTAAPSPTTAPAAPTTAAPKPTTAPAATTAPAPTTAPAATSAAAPTTAAKPTTAAAASPAAQATPAAKPAGQAFAGNIKMWVQHYTPTDSMTPTAQNPVPKKAVRDLANKYQEMYPNVKIEFVPNPPTGQDQRVWTETLQAGGTPPNIMWQHSFQIDDDVKKNWWVPLDPYMEQPNPYIKSGPGSAKWIDEFYEVPTSTKRSIDGKLYVTPMDLVTTYFYYNKDNFQKAGVQPPKTWAEFMTVMQKLKDAKFVPNAKPGWSDTQVAQMVFGSLSEKVHPGGGAVTRKEVECAISNKVWDVNTPMGKDYFKILKDMTPYFAPDWAATGVDFGQKFHRGEVSIFEDGTWRFGNLKFDNLLKFQYGTFYCPTVTKETTQYATGLAAPPIGGATAAQWAITTKSQKDNVLDLCVDILRYYSAPENATVFIQEASSFLPNIKGVQVNPELEAPLKAITTGFGEAAMFVYGDKVSQETGTKRDTVVANMRLGQISVDQAAQQYQEVQMSGAKDDIAKNNWTCPTS